MTSTEASVNSLMNDNHEKKNNNKQGVGKTFLPPEKNFLLTPTTKLAIFLSVLV